MQVLLLLITLVVNQVAYVGCLRCPALTQVMSSETVLLNKADWCRQESSLLLETLHAVCYYPSVGMKTNILQETEV